MVSYCRKRGRGYTNTRVNQWKNDSIDQGVRFDLSRINGQDRSKLTCSSCKGGWDEGLRTTSVLRSFFSLFSIFDLKYHLIKFALTKVLLSISHFVLKPFASSITKVKVIPAPPLPAAFENVEPIMFGSN